MRRLLPLLLLVLSFSIVKAQGRQWPLMPEQIFAPDIPIEYIVVPSPFDDRMWDDDVRVLAIDGNLYRYPPAFQRLTALGEIDEDTVLIGNSISAVPNAIHQIWAFDRTTHQITQFESACVDDEYLYASDVIDEPWTIVESGDQAVLCHHSTGERSEPLPSDYTWVIETFGGMSPGPVLSVSPDRRYVAFLGQIGLEQQSMSQRELELFSYDTVSQQIISLGQFSAKSSLQFDTWAGNQFTLRTGETCNICGHTVYVADASTAGSIEDAFGYLNVRGPALLQDPPRYGFGIENPYAVAPCGHSVYDIATRTMTETQLAGCRPDFGSIDGVAYYRNIPERGSLGPTSECCDIVPAEVPTVPVLRYDARTGESEEIYVGEVEQVVWVSSDERYAILLEDTNGVIDNVPYSRFPVEPQYGFTYLHLIDLTTGRLLASVVDVDDYPQFTILPANDHEFIIIDCYGEPCGGPVLVDASFLTIDDDGEPHEERLLHNLVIGATPDLSGILYWTAYYPPDRDPVYAEHLSGIGIYDIETGETLQLVNPLDPVLFRIEVERRNEEMLIVQVNPRFDTNTDRDAIFADGRFVVHFEPGEMPVVQIQHSFQEVGDYACLLYTGIVAANLRVLPGGDQERFGATIRGQTLLADGQAISPNDNMTWWRLADGGWVRSDFTMESNACASLPTVDPALNEGHIPVLQGAAVTCTVTTLAGVNLRSGADVEFEAIGSAAEGTALTADGYQRSTSDLTHWWRLTTGEWVRSDFVQEDEGCAEVPEVSATDPSQIAATPIGGPVCALTTTGGVNLRSGPGANYDYVGSAAEGTPLVGTGQAMSTSDFILWWQLDNGAWVRSDYTDEAANCASLPTVTPPDPPSTG